MTQESVRLRAKLTKMRHYLQIQGQQQQTAVKFTIIFNPLIRIPPNLQIKLPIYQSLLFSIQRGSSTSSQGVSEQKFRSWMHEVKAHFTIWGVRKQKSAQWKWCVALTNVSCTSANEGMCCKSSLGKWCKDKNCFNKQIQTQINNLSEVWNRYKFNIL